MFRALKSLRWGQLDQVREPALEGDDRKQPALKRQSVVRGFRGQRLEILPQAVLISAIAQYLGPLGICHLAECNLYWRGLYTPEPPRGPAP